ncbi:MAG: efflux RND transporter periplasmic adaptor subunit [Verrucomicrobia bacterium]|nr:efflux RND transporter periplasmic adaptor subunit [Verrucomicrobiota bacterium]
MQPQPSPESLSAGQMFRIAKVAFIGATIVGLTIVAGLSGCSKAPVERKLSALPVHVLPAREPQPADFAEAPRLLGAVRGDVETTLSFRMGGLIEWIGPDNDSRGWREGTVVKAGAPLARLIDTDFQSAVSAAQAAVERERAAFERTQKLVADKVVSPQDFDRAKAAADAAEAELRKAKQALADSIIMAPADGVILSRQMERGEMAAPGNPVLRFGDFRRMSVTLAVPDRWIGFFRVGGQIPFTVSAYEGRPFVGVISEVGVAARSTDRLFKVELKIDNADGALRSGMTASVPIVAADLISKATGKALVVPLAALSTRAVAGKAAQIIVYVVDAQNVARERVVETGEIVGSSILITGGELRSGERVISSASDELHPGAPVVVISESPTASRASLARR